MQGTKRLIILMMEGPQACNDFMELSVGDLHENKLFASTNSSGIGEPNPPLHKTFQWDHQNHFFLTEICLRRTNTKCTKGFFFNHFTQTRISSQRRRGFNLRNFHSTSTTKEVPSKLQDKYSNLLGDASSPVWNLRAAI